MEENVKAAVFWSGGKDACQALHRVLQSGSVDVRYLISTLNTETKRVSMHGISEPLIDAQASSIGIPLRKMWVNGKGNEAYEEALSATFTGLKEEDISHIIYGDIFLEEIRNYREQLMCKYGLKGIYPLWNENSGELISAFLKNGFRAVTCCVNAEVLDESFAGRIITTQFIQDLPAAVDACGENGEYHSFVFDGPVFRELVAFTIGEKIFKPVELKTNTGLQQTQGFWYAYLLP